MSTERYVFVSYAHKDAAIVLPCVEAMRKSGINVWYDEGIQAGSEWPEYIAEKVAYCAKFILFISAAYLESQNCKRELNFAISRKKDILSVFIEDVTLSLGVEMQLGTYQSIFRSRYANDAAFCQSLSGEAWFNDCRTAPQAAPAPQAQAAPVNPAPQATTYTAPQAPTNTPPKTQPYTGHTPIHSTQTSAPGGGAQKNADWISSLFGDIVGGTSGTSGWSTRSTAAKKPGFVRKRMIAAVLAIVLGSFGAHKFYLGKYVVGFLYFAFFWTYIPLILGVIEGVLMLISGDEKFDQKYNQA